MATYTAHDTETGEDYRFRSLDALARRLGGDNWNIEYSGNFNPAAYRIEITRTDRYGKHIVCCVSVPAEALATSEQEAGADLGEKD